MSKIVLRLSILCISFIILICIWNALPNTEEKGVHQATFCNTIHKEPQLKSEDALLQRVEFYYRNRTPSYALHQPKFYPRYTQKLIHQYLALSAAQQQQARHDYQQCRTLMKN